MDNYIVLRGIMVNKDGTLDEETRAHGPFPTKDLADAYPAIKPIPETVWTETVKLENP
jgi:hypothetical protein